MGRNDLFLDNFSGSVEGVLKYNENYVSQNNKKFIELYIGPKQFLIQPDQRHPLGQRLIKLDLNKYQGKNLLMSGDANTIIKFEVDSKIVGIISDSVDSEKWPKEEEEELWRLWHDEKITPQDLSNIFARDEQQDIRIKVVALSRIIMETAINPKGIESFFYNLIDKANCIIGASDINNPGQYIYFDSYCRPMIYEATDSEALFSSLVVDTKNNEVSTVISFRYKNDYILNGFKGINANQIEKSDFIKSRIARFQGDKETQYFFKIVVSTFDGAISSYYYIISTSEEDLDIIDENYRGKFLEYILYLEKVYLEKQNKALREQTIRSAIAMIMSRNMSHNLGSHVLYYTQQDLIETSNEYDKDLYQISHAHDETELSSKLTKLEYLPYSSSLRGCSFLVSFLKNRTNYVAAIAEDVKFPSLPVSFKTEIWDFIINIDKNTEAKKTVNYYLKNLIKSEGFTRSVPHGELKKGELRIKIDSSNVNSRDLNYMSLSLPGGTIAIQAFCNIIENFIRNSAKYWTGKYDSKIFNLIFTLKLSIDNENLCILIYDNKGDAEYNLTNLQNKLDRLIILNEDGSLNKEDKGLKEMILSYLWLRSDAYNESLSKYIYKLDSEVPEIRKRIKENIKSSFCYCEVENNLGLKFYLPIHYVRKEIDENTSSCEKIHADVVSARKEIIVKEKLDQIFPRITTLDTAGDVWDLKKECVNEINENHYRETQELYRAICTRFNTNIDDYKLYFERSDPNQPLIREAGLREMRNIPDKQIYFSTHLNAKQFTSSEILDFYNKYLYVDSISGGNYTKVLEQLLDSSFDKYYHLNTWENKLLSLKIKESAVTRITIIDERLFGGVEHWINLSKLQKQTGSHSIKDSQIELSLRNIRVLNWRGNKGVTNSFEKIPTVNELPIFCGNEFRNVGPYSSCPQKTNFLTIHLGVIEEMLKSDNNLINNICGVNEGNPLSNERISKLMSKIQEVFEPDFICIHSGRGGLSEETEKTILCQYPFLPFSTLESVFNDSKFLLSQMFYSMKYKKIL